MNRARAREWTLMLCVPFVSLIILARQVYLRSQYGLSSWKGGGMGMFASADDLANRCAKVFLVEPSGTKNPITQFSPDETHFLESALEYPSRQNFLDAAREIAK